MRLVVRVVLVQVGLDVHAARDDVHVVNTGALVYVHIGDDHIHSQVHLADGDRGSDDLRRRGRVGIRIHGQLATAQVQRAGGGGAVRVLRAVHQRSDLRAGIRHGDVGFQVAHGHADRRGRADRLGPHLRNGVHGSAAGLDARDAVHGGVAAADLGLEFAARPGDQHIQRCVGPGDVDRRRSDVRVRERIALGFNGQRAGDVGAVGSELGLDIRRDDRRGGVGLDVHQADGGAAAVLVFLLGCRAAHDGLRAGLVCIVVEFGSDVGRSRFDAAAAGGSGLLRAQIGEGEVQGDRRDAHLEHRRLDLRHGLRRADGFHVQLAGCLGQALALDVRAGVGLDLREGQVQAHVHQAGGQTAERRVDDAVGVCVVVGFDIQIAAHGEAAGLAVTGADAGLEAARRHGKRVHQANGVGREREVVDIRVGLGLAVALHGQVATHVQLVALHLGNARGIRGGDGGVGVDGERAGGGGEDVGLRHGLELRDQRLGGG